MRAADAFVVSALLMTCLIPAWAQQPVPPAPAASAPKAPPPPPMINRWVDAHGQVHYSDALPADAPEQTTEVGPLQVTTPEQKVQADAQLQQYRSDLQPLPTTPQVAAPQAVPTESQPSDDSCARQWARFNAAAACASQYHVAGGGLNGAFAQNCPTVPQPQCPPPGP